MAAVRAFRIVNIVLMATLRTGTRRDVSAFVIVISAVFIGFFHGEKLYLATGLTAVNV